MLRCCQARSQLENEYKIIAQLARGAEIRSGDDFKGFAAVFTTGFYLRNSISPSAWGKMGPRSFPHLECLGIELVQALCFLVYSGLKDEKIFFCAKK